MCQVTAALNDVVGPDGVLLANVAALAPVVGGAQASVLDLIERAALTCGRQCHVYGVDDTLTVHAYLHTLRQDLARLDAALGNTSTCRGIRQMLPDFAINITGGKFVPIVASGSHSWCGGVP